MDEDVGHVRNFLMPSTLNGIDLAICTNTGGRTGISAQNALHMGAQKRGWISLHSPRS